MKKYVLIYGGAQAGRVPVSGGRALVADLWRSGCRRFRRAWHLAESGDSECEQLTVETAGAIIRAISDELKGLSNDRSFTKKSMLPGDCHGGFAGRSGRGVGPSFFRDVR